MYLIWIFLTRMWTFLRMQSVSTLVGVRVGPDCSVSSPQTIYIRWHFASGATPGKSTSSCTLTCTVNSGRPCSGLTPGQRGSADASLLAVKQLQRLWPHATRRLGSWLFGRSLVALPLPLQSYCQGNSKRAAHHLVHYHTEMLPGSREAGKPVPGITFFLLPLPGTVCLLFHNLYFCCLPGKVVW